jgi:toxin ParE1/3/4
MERYEVSITEDALQDMEDIYRYIAEKLQSPENAIGQYNRIADEILTLSSFPERNRTVDFEPERQAGLRRLLVDNYSVFYVIREQRVIVTNVLYSASDIEQRLKR